MSGKSTGNLPAPRKLTAGGYRPSIFWMISRKKKPARLIIHSGREKLKKLSKATACWLKSCRLMPDRLLPNLGLNRAGISKQEKLKNGIKTVISRPESKRFPAPGLKWTGLHRWVT